MAVQIANIMLRGILKETAKDFIVGDDLYDVYDYINKRISFVLIKKYYFDIIKTISDKIEVDINELQRELQRELQKENGEVNFNPPNMNSQILDFQKKIRDMIKRNKDKK